MLICCKIDCDPALLARAMRQSGERRRNKAARIVPGKARAASLTAGLLLEYCLRKSGADPSQICFSPRGKPCLAGGPFFSLSHSGDYAVCAVGARPVGVDIQRVVQAQEKVVGRVCTPDERRMLARSENPARDFTRLWALKESWLKAADAQMTEMFSAGFSLGEEISGPEGFSFRLYEQIDGYVLALCERR